MSYKTLYRKYRPSNFDEVVGQQHIVKTIKNALETNHLSHAYLFCGPRGTGKTSLAKLLAKACNCESNESSICNECENCKESKIGNHPDIIELDAASNNGVDQIREIVEKVKYTPIIGKYKIYIIDEVHMLSTSAFNALLKTLEEPPAYVIFILATTDPQKVLPTIVSRCQRYNFTKITVDDIQLKLGQILEKEGVEYNAEATKLVAELADGGMRDALSILEQCLAYSSDYLSEDKVAEVFGVTSVKDQVDLLVKLSNQQYNQALEKFEKMANQGIDIKRLVKTLLSLIKELLFYKLTNDGELLNLVSIDEANSLLATFSDEFLQQVITVLMETENNFRQSDNVKLYFELAMLKIMKQSNQPVTNKVMETKNQPVKSPIKNPFEKPVVDAPIVKASEPVVAPVVEITEPTKVETTMVVDDIIVTDDVNQIVDDVTNTIDMDFYLSLLVQANKVEKEQMLASFDKLKDLKSNMLIARFARMLDETSIVACGQDFVLVSAPYEALANEINEYHMNKCLYQFMIEELQEERMIFAIDNKKYGELIDYFRTCRANNQLPNPTPIIKHQLQVVVDKVDRDENLEKIKSLFNTEDIIVEEN